MLSRSAGRILLTIIMKTLNIKNKKIIKRFVKPAVVSGLSTQNSRQQEDEPERVQESAFLCQGGQ